MKIRRFLSLFLLTVLLSILTAVPAYGLEDPAIRAKAALLVDVGSDTILYEKDIHAELDIASTTKIMSALLIFEAIDRGDLRMDQSITATASALKGLPEDGSTADIGGRNADGGAAALLYAGHLRQRDVQHPR